MTWSIFRPRSQRNEPRSVRPKHPKPPGYPPMSPPSRRLAIDSPQNSVSIYSDGMDTSRASSHTVLDPESSPLSGLNTLPPPAAPLIPLHSSRSPNLLPTQSGNSVKKRASMHSVRSIGSRADSSRSFKSMRARQIRAAHAAKHAAARYIAENSESSLFCYTCGQQIKEVKCEACRTTYLPPEYDFNASSAVRFGFSDIFESGNTTGFEPSAADCTPATTVFNAKISSSSAVSISGISISSMSTSGAASFIGFYPEADDDLGGARSQLDLELVSDLARLDESSVLEAVLFEGFSFTDGPSAFYKMNCVKESRDCSPETRVSAVGGSSENADGANASYGANASFGANADNAGHYGSNGNLSAPERETNKEPKCKSWNNVQDPMNTLPSTPQLPFQICDHSSLDANSLATLTGGEPLIDNAMVEHFYDTLAAVPSSAPMRGVLQGAQCILQTRRHAPINSKELAFICIILQCPVIADCSMFTKITGPLQKLSKYASLRSRARMVLEMCAGLVVHSDVSLHPLFCQVFASVDADRLAGLVDICNAYVSHRLSFDFHYKSRGASSSSSPTRFQLVRHDWYADDWRLSAVVRLLALLWEANKIRNEDKTVTSLPAHRFYNTMVDLVDLKSDFDSWQASGSRKKVRFCFCRYPFLLSMGSKARVFEHSIQRVVNSAIQREMFAVMASTRNARSLESQQAQIANLKNFTLHVRRQHLLEDSVKRLTEWPQSQRRALKVEFEGEPGIDAGGLKKEWFLMFYKQIFDPELKVFVMDQTSNYCWFGKNEDITYYTVAGTALGLAVFNSITIDLNLPLLLFKLLLDFPYDLNDIATLWPEIAQSLQNILDYSEDDFEEVFGLTFSAPDGTQLIADGDSINVTSQSKETYVDLLVEHMINTSGEQFQAFRHAFLDVCGGNALTLFQPEELELLTKGDRKPIDIQALRSVTKYVNFGHRYEKANMEPIVQWFWSYFEKLDAMSQARLLQFVTATDRPPAAGMVQMRFKIMCLGGDSERLPVAHTCFNQLGLYKYKSRKKLERKLSLAIAEYQGFGLK